MEAWPLTFGGVRGSTAARHGALFNITEGWGVWPTCLEVGTLKSMLCAESSLCEASTPCVREQRLGVARAGDATVLFDISLAFCCLCAAFVGAAGRA
jgi:hypothetical protein